VPDNVVEYAIEEITTYAVGHAREVIEPPIEPSAPSVPRAKKTLPPPSYWGT